MQKYKYTAVDLKKQKFTGIFIAENEHDLAVQLSKQNLFLLSCVPYKGLSAAATFWTLGTGKVTIGELTNFCRQFAIMINSGMSILAAIECLKAQKYSALFKQALEVIYDDVKAGVMLSEALNKHGKIFPNFFRSMIYVGEASGKLDMVLNSLADYYENDSKIRRKAKSSLSYPIMLLAMTVGIFILMMVFIVPTFRESLSSLDVEVEGITKVVYNMSDWMLANWTSVLLAVVVVGLLLFLIGQTEKGKYIFDVIKLRFPLLGQITVDLITARFARGFGLLLAGGMDIVDAMDAVLIVLGNRDVEKRFKLATNDVRQGKPLAMVFEKYKLFPEILIQMISVGEKTASLQDVLGRSCSFFDDQVESTLTSVTSAIQPVMLGLMGGVVGVLFIAIYSPMLSIMTSIA